MQALSQDQKLVKTTYETCGYPFLKKSQEDYYSILEKPENSFPKTSLEVLYTQPYLKRTVRDSVLKELLTKLNTASAKEFQALVSLIEAPKDRNAQMQSLQSKAKEVDSLLAQVSQYFKEKFLDQKKRWQEDSDGIHLHNIHNNVATHRRGRLEMATCRNEKPYAKSADNLETLFPTMEYRR